MRRQLAATFIGAIALTALQIAAGIALVTPPPPPGPEAAAATTGAGHLWWALLANLLIAATLAWFARGAAWAGWRLALALFSVAFGIGHANSLIEAYVFGFFPRPGEVQALFASAFVTTAVFAPLLVWLVGRWREAGAAEVPPPRRSAINWAVRFAAGAVAYLVLYFTAGMIIYPYVQGFYEQRPLPQGATIAGLQLFVRGPVFVLLGWVITRMVPGSRARHALLVAVAMSVVGGAAPLLVPNPYFPDAVRWVHFAEVVSSNFVFGAIVGWLWE
ncbi:MAG: hypothetical protein KJ061_13950 [Vicinamibacteraceae bacterium]|nr:hypothetical protein [Vicinamibacteraceae bacterium]